MLERIGGRRNSVMDFQTITMPEGIDIDVVYDFVQKNPDVLDRVVKEVLHARDVKPQMDETNSSDRQLKIKQLIEEIKDNNIKFDALMEEYNKCGTDNK